MYGVHLAIQQSSQFSSQKLAGTLSQRFVTVSYSENPCIANSNFRTAGSRLGFGVLPSRQSNEWPSFQIRRVVDSRACNPRLPLVDGSVKFCKLKRKNLYWKTKMTRSYPKELRWRVIYMSREGRSARDIANTLHVGKTFVHKIINICFKRAVPSNIREDPAKLEVWTVGLFMWFLMQW